MQPIRFIIWYAVVFALLPFPCGCREKKEETLAVHPVTGQVLVNKLAAAGVEITLYPVQAEDRDPKNWKVGYPRAISDDDGAFSISTYGKNDGAPQGKYLVLARWMEGSGEKISDRFRGRYFNPETATRSFDVLPQPNELNIQLSN